MSTSVPDARPREIATFGAVHLEVVSLSRSAAFWRDVIGLVERPGAGGVVELGTADETLVTLHPGAVAGFQQRHSGLYHLAIHPPTEPDFARILLRIARARWPVSPTDHVMSKALYLLDPDGITVEITLETPARFREFVVTDTSVHVVHADGSISSGRDPLNVARVMATLADDRLQPVPAGTRIGHVHLYVGDLASAYAFYEGFGFNRATWSPHFQTGDLGAGGRFNHRVAMNTWQGIGAPQSPPGTARMRHFTISLDTDQRLDAVLGVLPSVTETEHGYATTDPSGNKIMLTRA